MPKSFQVWIVVLVLCLCPLAGIAEPTGTVWQPGLHDLSAIALVAGAQGAFSQLELEQPPNQRRIYLTSALSALSALYQLHGFEWALERLLPLYEDADCPNVHFGYSTDGRVRLTIEPLELANPAFEEFTILLITLESNSGDIILADSFGPMKVVLPDGQVIQPDLLSPGHELWARVKNLAYTFEPPPIIHPGGATAFKQVYAVRQLGDKAILAVSLDWDGYTIGVPYYENQLAGNSLE